LITVPLETGGTVNKVDQRDSPTSNTIASETVRQKIPTHQLGRRPGPAEKSRRVKTQLSELPDFKCSISCLSALIATLDNAYTEIVKPIDADSIPAPAAVIGPDIPNIFINPQKHIWKITAPLIISSKRFACSIPVSFMWSD